MSLHDHELTRAKTAYNSCLRQLASAEMAYSRMPNNSAAIQNLARARQFAAQAEAAYLAKAMENKQQ